MRAIACYGVDLVVRWLLACLLLVSMVGAPSAIAGQAAAGDPAVPSFAPADDGASAAPHSPACDELPYPDEDLAPACASGLGAPDGTPTRGYRVTAMPAGTDRPVPRPPPTR